MLPNYDDGLFIFLHLGLLLSYLVSHHNLLSSYSREIPFHNSQRLYSHFLNCIINIMILFTLSNTVSHGRMDFFFKFMHELFNYNAVFSN